MKTAIMQPYFLPYIGYWQLIHSVDQFIIYDNIEYTKKGWFNRNRILDANHDRLFTVPIKKDSDYLPVNKRFLGEESDKEISRVLRVIEATYKKAPQFPNVFPIIKECFLFSDKNLFNYIYHSIQSICAFLNIQTKIIIASEVTIDHMLKGQEKVLALCAATGSTTYVNAIGGTELYDKQEFASQDVELQFIKSKPIEYKQFENDFVPWLSIVDVLMFNDVATIRHMLHEYELL